MPEKVRILFVSGLRMSLFWSHLATESVNISRRTGSLELLLVNMNVTDPEIREILNNYKQFTVYGLSPDPAKASHEVPKFLHAKGYDIAGVYPKPFQYDDFKIYTSLQDVPASHRRLVDVFRRSEHIPQLVDEILALGGVEVLWLQLGITHPEAEEKAQRAGLKVISDRCMKIEYKRFFE